jgi:hypothetical protein
MCEEKKSGTNKIAHIESRGLTWSAPFFAHAMTHRQPVLARGGVLVSELTPPATRSPPSWRQRQLEGSVYAWKREGQQRHHALAAH